MMACLLISSIQASIDLIYLLQPMITILNSENEILQLLIFFIQQTIQKMNEILLPYSLTQYTNFRKLEFDFSKLRDQNEELKKKKDELQKLYAQLFSELESQKCKTDNNRQQLSTLRSSQKNQMIISINKLQRIVQKLMKNSSQKKGGKKQKASDITEIVNILESQIEELCRQMEKSKQLVAKYYSEKQETLKRMKQREEGFSDEIADLQLDLQSLQKMEEDLKLENNRLLKQNQDLQLQVKSYKTIAIQARNKNVTTLQNNISMQLNRDFNEQDKDFANDILNYEKEQLSKVFQMIITCFGEQDIGLCLKNVQLAYKDVVDAFQEKLQLQYDLADLECQYQKRKLTGNKEITVQIRKQINNFRKQLFNQKQILHKKEQLLQQKISDLTGQVSHDRRLKNFTATLQGKLNRKNIIEENEESQENLMKGVNRIKKQNQESRIKMKSVQFRQTFQADELVRQMIEKDRQNLERMLQDTRSQFRK